MRLKDEYMDEIDEQFDRMIAPQEDKLDIASFDDDSIDDGLPF